MFTNVKPIWGKNELGFIDIVNFRLNPSNLQTAPDPTLDQP